MSKMSPFSEFGQACKRARESMLWTYERATCEINNLCIKREQVCDVRSLKRWEKGDGLPKIEPVYAMSRAYRNPELISLRIAAIELATKEKVHSAKWTN